MAALTNEDEHYWVVHSNEARKRGALRYIKYVVIPPPPPAFCMSSIS
jgi:hypothetical protein